MRRLFLLLIIPITMVTFITGCGRTTNTSPDDGIRIATVVKLAGINWFNRLEEGVQAFGDDFQVTTFQKGPERADGALQIQIIEDLIALDVDAICVVPMSPETLEPVLKKAMENDIVVITHEASSQQNKHFDIEAFDNAAFGRHLMDHLAERIGGAGQYAVFVGSLTSKTHNEWVDAAIEHQRTHYPDMVLVGDKNESYDDVQLAYEKTKELLKTYPDVRGFQGSASTDVAGIGQAVEEAGLHDRITVVGTSLPSVAGDLLDTGAVDLISFWDPKLAGYACNHLALMVLSGEVPTDGMNLRLPGYESLQLKDHVLYGQAWVDVTAGNAAQYPF